MAVKLSALKFLDRPPRSTTGPFSAPAEETKPGVIFVFFFFLVFGFFGFYLRPLVSMAVAMGYTVARGYWLFFEGGVFLLENIIFSSALQPTVSMAVAGRARTRELVK